MSLSLSGRVLFWQKVFFFFELLLAKRYFSTVILFLMLDSRFIHLSYGQLIYFAGSLFCHDKVSWPRKLHSFQEVVRLLAFHLTV